MSRLALPLLLISLLCAPAWGAGALVSARTEATAARQQANEIRARQMKLRTELNQVAARIEALKSTQKGPLAPGSELEGALRRSQELSDALTEAAQAQAQAQATLEAEHLALLEALNQDLSALHATWDRTEDRAARQAVVDRMRALRLEREQVRALLPASRLPAVAKGTTDDPEDLLEQADLLRDNEDKVRQKMQALQARITELREEHELDRRMSDFLGDESMFDEQDRRLRKELARGVATARQPPLFGGGADQAQEAAAAPQDAASGGFQSSPPSERNSGGQEPVPLSPPSDPVIVTQIARGVDARPQVSGGVDALLLDTVDTTSVEALEAQLQKLKALAKELEARATQLEQKARAQ